MVEEEEEEVASSTSSSYSSSESTSSSSSSYPWRLLLPPPDGSFVVRRGARKADPWLRGGAMERIGSACCCIPRHRVYTVNVIHLFKITSWIALLE